MLSREDDYCLLLMGKDNLVYQALNTIHSDKDDAIFRTLYTTVCGSDLRIISDGDARIVGPRVLGHEVVAEVVTSGSRDDFIPGDVVAIGADIPCGKCPFCNTHRENLCVEHIAMGYQLDGGFSTRIVIPSRFLKFAPIVKVPVSIDFAPYSLAEPLGCVIHGVEFSAVNQDCTILIIGCGPIGIMLAQVCNIIAKVAKTDILLVDPSAKRRAFAESIGFRVLDKVDNVESTLRFDRIFTATSEVSFQNNLLGLVQRGGRLNFFGGVPKETSKLFLDSNFLHYSEIALEGSHGSTPSHHKEAVELISKDVGFWSSLISSRISLNQLPSYLDRLRRGKEMKVSVHFDK